MDFEYISSRDNRLIKSVRALVSSSKERREKGQFVLEGLRLCADAVQNGYEIDVAVFSDAVDSEQFGDILKKASRRVQVPDGLFSYISDTVNPQGILCVIKAPRSYSMQEIKGGRYIMLEKTADPANLGAIARTAEAFGISGMIVSAGSCDVFSPKAQRAAMGALLRLPVYLCDDAAGAVRILKSAGFKMYASVVRDAQSILDVQFPENCVTVVGNEANGITERTEKLCDEKITIVMRGKAESLNASAAAAVIMWEMMKN